jgi:spore coat-associated protein N
MSIKKKLGLGVASAALGISLVGGGTWAAFNDTATINNHFAAGELDLTVGPSGSKPISFDLTNMKPGDNVQRIFNLKNDGSLAIKEVLLNTTAENFDGGDDSTRGEFLSQFKVDFMKVDTESAAHQPSESVLVNGAELTLADLVAGPDYYSSKIKSTYLATDGTKRINLAPLTADATTGKKGIPVKPEDSDAVFIQITFKDDKTRVAGQYSDYVQNKFMNDKIDFFFNLEATQWDGVHVDSHHKNGEINNAVQSSADGNSMPDPRTEGSATHESSVTDN